jgi:uncharacterized protein (DUF1778 family)
MNQPKRGRPPAEGETASGHIQARTTMSRKNAYVRAAQARKMKLTEWIFDCCDKAAGYSDQD